MGITRSIDCTDLSLDEKMDNLAGIGRTTENVKANADAIISNALAISNGDSFIGYGYEPAGGGYKN